MEASGKMKKNTKFKQQILNYLSRRLEEHYEYNSNFNVENSQVTNKFHKGDTYSIQGKSDKVTITNKDNGKVHILDLDKLTKELPLDEKVKIKKFISQLPGEVMMDLAIELDSFKNKADFVDRIIFKNASGVYNGWSDSITLGMNGSDSIDSLVHELGHAIDNTTRHLLFESSHYEKFKKAFEEGLAAFTSLGYKRSKGTGDKNVGFGYVKKEGFITERAANYATTNIKEMFAECYQYLMTGTCLSADMLEDFFPECLSIADEMLEVIRNLPDEKRHKRS